MGGWVLVGVGWLVVLGIAGGGLENNSVWGGGDGWVDIGIQEYY